MSGTQKILRTCRSPTVGWLAESGRVRRCSIPYASARVGMDQKVFFVPTISRDGSGHLA